MLKQSRSAADAVRPFFTPVEDVQETRSLCLTGAVPEWFVVLHAVFAGHQRRGVAYEAGHVARIRPHIAAHHSS